MAKITAISRAGRTWSASPGPAWPLAAAYSFAANKFITWAVYSAFYLFSAAIFCLPRSFSVLLNSIYLFWEARLYPGALRLAYSVVRSAGAEGTVPPAGAVKSGRITEDETWSGKITTADYLIIERGVRVNVQPGCEITFTRREPWFLPVLRAGSDGTRRELDSSLAKILVYGEISASGTPDSPVVFRGASFGGLHALGEGRIVMRDCRLENSAACALTARDRAAAELERCSFVSCRGGTEASGFASLYLKDCGFSDSGGPALRLMDSSLSSVFGCTARGCSGPAVEAGGEASAALYAFSAEGCASGIEASGLSALRLDGCRFEGNAGHAFQLRGSARLEAAGCAVSG
ncbi:MAG: right-handed parallel beta-helix repeat-containing protein, partial [Elusimicrobiota bacterium]|nr:right-handed parallel beta-helix repeat-containing protein [Elusimicrobiota bacterium]